MKKFAQEKSGTPYAPSDVIDNISGSNLFLLVDLGRSTSCSRLREEQRKVWKLTMLKLEEK